MTPSRALYGACLFAAMVGCFLNGPHQHTSGNPYTGPVASVPGDLPCDVAHALAPCQSCHGAVPTNSAPMALVSRADLTAQSPQFPGQTEAERAVARMNGIPTPMPPAATTTSSASDIDAISAWIAAGYPTGQCSTQTSQCTSGIAGTKSEGAQMRPGEACISCHSRDDGPIDDFMGTVFPTLHEPNDCVGASSQDYAGVRVVIVDAVGKEYAMTPNTAGNFRGSASLTMPFTAKVEYQGRVIAMTTPQSSGDCNACHAETGTDGAPGRIMLP